MKKKSWFKKLFLSFKYAFDGYLTVFKEERNMKIHTVMAFLVIVMGCYFEITSIEWMFVIFAIGLVISAEIINTSIENVVDLLTKEINETARIVKDTSAAFVLVSSIASAIIGLIIFIPKIIERVI